MPKIKKKNKFVHKDMPFCYKGLQSSLNMKNKKGMILQYYAPHLERNKECCSEQLGNSLTLDRKLELSSSGHRTNQVFCVLVSSPENKRWIKRSLSILNALILGSDNTRCMHTHIITQATIFITSFNYMVHSKDNGLKICHLAS